jgi:hypothetical protein
MFGCYLGVSECLPLIVKLFIGSFTYLFWCYVKSKNEDNMGISPLLSAGKLVSDSTHKAKLLVNQFSSVFTKDDGNPSPHVSRYVNEPINNLTIRGRHDTGL